MAFLFLCHVDQAQRVETSRFNVLSGVSPDIDIVATMKKYSRDPSTALRVTIVVPRLVRGTF